MYLQESESLERLPFPVATLQRPRVVAGFPFFSSKHCSHILTYSVSSLVDTNSSLISLKKMSGAIINVTYIPPYKNKKTGRFEPNQAVPATVSTLNLTAPATTSNHGYVDYSDMPKTTKKVVKKSKIHYSFSFWV